MWSRRIAVFATLSLAALTLRAESPGQRELTSGREALARREHAAAAKHLRAATEALDPVAEKEALAEAWLQLGIAELTGLDRAEDALAAFEKSAELAANPSSAWLWASTAAESLGRSGEAAGFKARALAPPPPPPPATPAAIPEPQPVPAAEPAPIAQPKPDAFQHFFGAKDPKAPPPEASSPPPPAPQAEPPQEKEVFQTLFGENRPDRPEGARQAQAEGEQGREKQAEAKQEEAKKAAPAKKGDAFRHFFGEKKKDGDVKKEQDEKKDDTAPPP